MPLKLQINPKTSETRIIILYLAALLVLHLEVCQFKDFNQKMMPSLAFKLIESQYFKSFKKYFAPSVYEGIVENFLALQPYEIETIIQSVFKQIPAEWESQKNLGDRIIEFLSDSKRIHSVKQLTMHSLKN